MPNETPQAIEWALQQTYVDGIGNSHPVTTDDPGALVDAVREYFNANIIAYSTFSYDDLRPYL